ncbi:MAG: response regulator transcription factor [Deltaproteobacteria bacterium]|nr:response regulator transcription factor [Deltaproteobacteria bacterium]
MPTILVADDDAHIREVVQFALEKDGYTVLIARDGAQALDLTRRENVDLLILDIIMPKLNGLEVCQRVRAESHLPVIFLSSKGDEVDRIVGLELGGDDYLAKPFSPRELVARVRAVLRRHAAPNADDSGPSALDRAISSGPIRLDPERHEVHCHDKHIQLTVNEFTLLHVLLRRPGRVTTRAVLVNEIYEQDHHITERTIDTYVRRIRAKFKATDVDPIETVFGLGYKAREL